MLASGTEVLTRGIKDIMKSFQWLFACFLLGLVAKEAFGSLPGNTKYRVSRVCFKKT